MDITGKIIKVLELRQGVSKSNGTPWMTQEYVLETVDDQYPKKMVFNIFGEDKIKSAAINEGDMVTVSFDINAREYQNRWYNDVRAWRVTHDTTAPAGAGSAPQAPTASSTPEFSPSNEADDLPF